MKHYKNPQTGEIFAFEKNGSQDKFILKELIEISEKEAEEVRNEKQKQKNQQLTYRELRAMEYPPIGDQLDALFHAGVFPADMAALIQAVKDKYPKP